jgi:hypothetical protein
MKFREFRTKSCGAQGRPVWTFVFNKQFILGLVKKPSEAAK